ncbi:hypothetical protein D3C72_2535140 [compost metagenome]
MHAQLGGNRRVQPQFGRVRGLGMLGHMGLDPMDGLELAAQDFGGRRAGALALLAELVVELLAVQRD